MIITFPLSDSNLVVAVFLYNAGVDEFTPIIRYILKGIPPYV